MSESQQRVYRRKRESYRLGQRNPYKLRPEIKQRILDSKELSRFVEDYFHINRSSVYRFFSNNDPALTQIGFLQELAEKMQDVGIFEYESLVEKAA